MVGVGGARRKSMLWMPNGLYRSAGGEGTVTTGYEHAHYVFL